ncbi:hypothetical protein ASPZODRAFT_143495 [Penicilliopsis zonata CBS 506.65]|uniref:Uncharacterized protein n=1 Tax=Penicilliopsis zonata CBS 506.65 TaxID=1073090 RepID=A0A1L9SF04_9EURO|nr:hypothetical protein ASPZODRAFT_143495 [Penicilliopsis zonata CBS 506.65]OJJ45604.1 hypothetical protein ASPZODRAFT_143495 [Penicilliopsis zonata CBS 506.65]
MYSYSQDLRFLVLSPIHYGPDESAVDDQPAVNDSLPVFPTLHRSDSTSSTDSTVSRMSETDSRLPSQFLFLGYPPVRREETTSRRPSAAAPSPSGFLFLGYDKPSPTRARPTPASAARKSIGPPMGFLYLGHD